MIELSSLRLRPGHLRVFSGRVTIGPDADLPCALRDLYAPPFAAPGFALAFDLVEPASGEAARDLPPGTPGYRDLMVLQSGQWQPDRLRRVALYHGPLGAGRIAVRVHQDLIPLADRPGALVLFRLEGLDGALPPLAFRLRPELPALARVEPTAWDWFPPRPEGCAAREIAPLLFEGRDAWLRIRADVERRGELFDVVAPGGAPARAAFLIELSGTRPEASGTRCEASEVREALHRADAAAARRSARVAETLPRFRAADSRLERFYERSLTTALLCRWEHPDFALDPHFAASGLDGGGVCTYLWDLYYISSFLPLMLAPAELRAILAAFFAMPPENFFAFEPFGGKGLGRTYALNAWSLTRLVHDFVASHGPGALGAEAESWLERLEALAEAGRPSPWPPLLDYGDTTHLLELRTGGYEHVVPSPNAERVALFENLARLREKLRLPGAGRLREKAESVRAALLRHLWDGSRSWFRCGRPDGSFEHVDSVQILALIGLGVLPDPIVKALAARVAEDDFLGPFGLHSIAPRDHRHYEAGDVDWGGGGSYVGQAPLLALDLYRIGEARRAEAVLDRIVWWADAWPYFPQSIRADRRDYCDFDRPHCVAALAGAQALVFGLAGFRRSLDKGLSIRPHAHGSGDYELSNLRFGGRRIDVEVGGRRYRVRIDGRETRVGRVGGA